MDWVRSGGILRDAEGTRDYARTEAIREEIRIGDLERVLLERWVKYEQRWAELNARAGRDRAMERDIRFRDVPWPVCGKDVTPADLTAEQVENFLLAGLKVRGCTVTKKERVRSSLLRWHRNKLTGVLGCIVDADLDAVRKGVNVVVSCLHQLNCRADSPA
ncbi:hypothetical protein B0H10DRAFT_1870199 [Mycena sp. CBHHK59/15]|nr:hypothetical protein B0H10DRAFT_1870199 [Mycena sp. CBHHK59/15]